MHAAQLAESVSEAKALQGAEQELGDSHSPTPPGHRSPKHAVTPTGKHATANARVAACAAVSEAKALQDAEEELGIQASDHELV